MVRLYTYPSQDVVPWEPEPLYLPVDVGRVPPPADDSDNHGDNGELDDLYGRRNRIPSRGWDDGDGKAIGSHVIVIDLA